MLLSIASTFCGANGIIFVAVTSHPTPEKKFMSSEIIYSVFTL